MPVRLRITLLFTLVVFMILGIVCISIYYFSASSRMANIKTRLTNRAITTARLLRQSEVFDTELMHSIDSLTTLSLKNKSVLAFDRNNNMIYRYSDPGSVIPVINGSLLKQAREKHSIYFTTGMREAVAYHNPRNTEGIVVVCAAQDEEGIIVLQRLKGILVTCFIGGTLLSLIGGLFFSRRLLRPIRRITNEVNDISAYNLERRIETGISRDEWFQLSSTLNQLLDRLKDSFELQRRFVVPPGIGEAPQGAQQTSVFAVEVRRPVVSRIGERQRLAVTRLGFG